MCGIVGIFNAVNLETSLTEFSKLLRNLSHRGPDAEGVYVSSDKPHILMGHTRLSIIDLSTNSNQPFETEKSVTIFNGEIYNYEELRRELKGKGVDFISEGDTEVISRGYDYWGRDIFKFIKGMYAIAIFDKITKSLFLGRDLFGIKPLYIYQSGKEIRFSSEIKSLSNTRNYNLNPEVLLDLMSFGYQFSLASIYEDVKQLSPGSIIEIRMEAEKPVIQEYAAKTANKSIPNHQFSFLSELFNLHHFQEVKSLLQDSVKRHLVSDVPLAISLSGGLDSSVIAALAANKNPNIVAYTNTLFPEGDYEVEYAKFLCKSLNIKHKVVHTKITNLESVLENIAWYLEEPIPNVACLNTFTLGKVLQDDGFKVALLGEGSDEIFGGYPWYLFALKDKFVKNPGDIFDAYQNRRSQAKNIFKYLTDEGKILLLNRNRTQKNIFIQEFENISASPLTKFMLFEISYQLQFSQLLRVDRMLMANSIEGRVPFLYDELLNKSFSIPDYLKIRENKRLQIPRLRNDKICLAEAVKSILPQKILRREKFGLQGTVNLYQSPGVLQIDSVFEKICQSSQYLESRDVLSRFLNWHNLNNLALSRKDKLLICLLCICVNQFVIGKVYCVKDQGYEISLIDK
ncbi:MAG: asparagine synthase (glutamine-hydrolyzing) [Goleter apudmare HA4340-LM2]|jgi:asparagine synthase (glutamine-hydrolysing)|nr:asparagine synthase (glutamine-hydrolyzing) [Goleter apudmare HA4340-LM2]